MAAESPRILSRQCDDVTTSLPPIPIPQSPRMWYKMGKISSYFSDVNQFSPQTDLPDFIADMSIWRTAHLNAILGEASFHGQQLARTHVRVVCLLEGLLQLLQLAAGEDRASVASLVLLLAAGTRAARTDKNIATMGGQQAIGIASSSARCSQKCLGMMGMGVGGMGGVSGMGVDMRVGMSVRLGVGVVSMMGGSSGSGMMMSGGRSSRCMLMGSQCGRVMRTSGRGATAGAAAVTAVSGCRGVAARRARSTARSAHTGSTAGSTIAGRWRAQVPEAIRGRIAATRSWSRSAGSAVARWTAILAGRLLISTGIGQTAGVLLATSGSLFCSEKMGYKG